MAPIPHPQYTEIALLHTHIGQIDAEYRKDRKEWEEAMATATLATQAATAHGDDLAQMLSAQEAAHRLVLDEKGQVLDNLSNEMDRLVNQCHSAMQDAGMWQRATETACAERDRAIEAQRALEAMPKRVDDLERQLDAAQDLAGNQGAVIAQAVSTLQGSPVSDPIDHALIHAVDEILMQRSSNQARIAELERERDQLLRNQQDRMEGQ